MAEVLTTHQTFFENIAVNPCQKQGMTEQGRRDDFDSCCCSHGLKDESSFCCIICIGNHEGLDSCRQICVMVTDLTKIGQPLLPVKEGDSNSEIGNAVQCSAPSKVFENVLSEAVVTA